jgi:hypothetical protein
MKDSTYAYPCPLCPGGAGSAGGLKTHAGRIHGKTPEVRKAIADRIAEIEKAKQPAEQKPKPDPLRTTPKLDEVHVHEQTAEGVIEAADFNADEPVAERECGECKHPTGECSDCGPKCEEYEEHVDLEERLEGHVQAMSTEEHSETHSRPKSAMLEVEVSVKDLKPVQSLLEFQGSMIHALAERVVELEGKRLFHRTPTVEDVRAWAEMEADRRKRQAFRDRMNVVIDEIEHVLFDVPADEADDAAA